MHDRPRPRISPDNRPFWEGCLAGEIRLPFCVACGRPHLPPGPVCPFCFSDQLEWRSASGKGWISTWTVVHKAWFPAFADQVPYNVVQVELDEGPRLTTNIVNPGEAGLVIGARVEVTFERIDDGLALPRFRLME
jgi:uncharacterized protein